MDDGELVLFHGAQPSCLLADRFRNISQPLQSCVVGPYIELTTQQVMSKIFQRVNNSKQFTACNAIIYLRATQYLTCVSNDTFFAIDELRENRADGKIERIGVQDVRILFGWHATGAVVRRLFISSKASWHS